MVAMANLSTSETKITRLLELLSQRLHTDSLLACSSSDTLEGNYEPYLARYV